MASRKRKIICSFYRFLRYFRAEYDDKNLYKSYLPRCRKKSTDYLTFKLISLEAGIGVITPMAIYFSVVLALISLWFKGNELPYQKFCLVYILFGVAFIAKVNRVKTVQKGIIKKVLKERENANCFKVEILKND